MPNEDLFDYLQKMQDYLERPHDSIEMAKSLIAFANEHHLRKVILVLDLAIRDIQAIDIPKESLALFSYELQARNSEQKQELEMIYKEDIKEAARLVVEFISNSNRE